MTKTNTTSRPLTTLKGNEGNIQSELTADNKLIITIDLTKRLGETANGNPRIATSYGNMSFQETPIEGLVIGLNCYVKEPKVKVSITSKQAAMLERVSKLTPEQMAAIANL